MQEPGTCNGSKGYGWRGLEEQAGTRKKTLLPTMRRAMGRTLARGRGEGLRLPTAWGSSGSGWLHHCIFKSWVGEICRKNETTRGGMRGGCRMERWKRMSQHLWWDQPQDEGELKVDVSRLPVTTSVQTLKQCCYYGKDTNKSILEQQTCLLQVYVIILKQ